MNRDEKADADIRVLGEAEIDAVAGAIGGNSYDFGFGIKMTVWDNGVVAVSYGGCVTTAAPDGRSATHCGIPT